MGAMATRMPCTSSSVIPTSEAVPAFNTYDTGGAPATCRVRWIPQSSRQERRGRGFLRSSGLSLSVRHRAERDDGRGRLIAGLDILAYDHRPRIIQIT